MIRRALVPVFAMLLVSLTTGRAEALSVRDVIELTKAGLSESVLLALIDVDRTVFSIDTATLKQLKSNGVTDSVIVAMIRSGREPQADVPPPIAEPPAPAPMPEEPMAQDATGAAEAPEAPAPQFIPYPVPVPFYVAVPIVPVNVKTHHGSAQRPHAVVPTNCFVSSLPQWGFGGRIGPPPAPGCH